MTGEQIVQILERKEGSNVWKVRTVIQIWPYDESERARTDRFLKEKP